MVAHHSECQAVGVTFVPLVMETLGGWNEEGILTVKRIGQLLGQRLGTSPAENTRHLLQHLSITLWKGNATMWLGCLPVNTAKIDGII